MANPHAQAAKNFAFANSLAVLSTHSKRHSGYPFGSIVPYDIDQNGDLIIYISFIAEHYKNLESNANACMTIKDAYGSHDPQSYSRASLLVKFEPVEEAQVEAVRLAYERRFPSSINYEIAHNFCFMKGVVERLRWIKGFGSMGWIDSEAYRNAPLDILAYESSNIIEHMNVDHADALSEYVKAYAKLEISPEYCNLVAIDQDGMDIQVYQSGKYQRVRVEFLSQIEKPADARSATIELLEQARKINSQ